MSEPDASSTGEGERSGDVGNPADGEHRRALVWNRHDGLAIAALLLAAAALFVQAYGRWFDPVIDIGRDLYLPSAILDGTKLYRDIFYVYPPLTPYLLAAWVFLFGAGLHSYASFGLFQALLCGAALYLSGRAAGSRSAGGAAAFLFLTWSFTGASTWNSSFVFPYAHAVTIGIACVMCAVALVVRHLFVQRSSLSLVVAVVLISAAGWCKLELAIVSICVIVVAVFVYRIPRVFAVGYVALNAGLFFLVSVYFSDAPAGHHWLWDNTLPRSLIGSDVAKRFYATVSGSDSWPQLLMRDLMALLVFAMEVLLLKWYSRRADRLSLALAMAGSLAVGLTLSFAYFFFAAWTPLLLLALWFGWKEGARSPLLLYASTAALSLFRIYLRPEPVWYGFALSVPLLALIGYFLFVTLPAREVYSRQASKLWWIVLIVISVPSVAQQVATYGSRDSVVLTPRGRFLDGDQGRAVALNQLFEHLARSGARDLVVFPEGLSLNYFAGLPTKLSHHMFTPVEADFPAVEADILREMRERTPGHVVIVPRDVREFGYRGWGVDYHRAIAAYLRANYDLERMFGSAEYPIVLLRRKSKVGRQQQSMPEKQNTSVQQTLQAR